MAESKPRNDTTTRKDGERRKDLRDFAPDPGPGSDDGTLESIGKAISSPVLGDEDEEAAKDRPHPDGPGGSGGR